MKTASLILFNLFLFAGSVLACQCIETGDTHEAFVESKLVVVTTLASVHRDGEGSPGADGIRRSMMKVEKVYKGGTRAGDELKIAQDSGSGCNWALDDEAVGRKFVLFLNINNPANDFWIVQSCFGSAPLEGSEDKIYYLDNIATLGDKTRLYGTIYRINERSYPERSAGRTVKIRGNGKTITLETDAAGKFSTYGLAPGKYTVMPAPLRGYKFTREQKDKYPVIELKPSAHAMTDFYFEKR